jgi:hypothetical protein
MRPEDDDALAERLFDAARAERPAMGVRQRALAAPPVKRRPQRAATLALLAALAVAGGAFWITGGRPSVPAREHLGAEPMRTPDGPSAVPEEETQRTAAPVPLPSMPAPPRRAAPIPPSESPVRPASLEEELGLLDEARTALLAENPELALERLGEYDRRATMRHLGAEASLLRIQVLFAAGRREDAAELARRFSEQNPNSPLAERARCYLEPSPAASVRIGDRP